ncbi:L-seryl-tRNA(Sec) selenium transferase [Actinoplanes sp. OR16]|nr:L-seryl-tRNA(Sec) selenium transferase [Actinoplanes sp. OR16]
MDPRRLIPRTDVVLSDPRLEAAAARLGRPAVKAAVADAQRKAREGVIDPGQVADAAVAGLPLGMRAVLNATGVVLHTNLGRAALSAAAVDAVVEAAGTTDVELDLRTGKRARRGRDALAALAAAVPEAQGVHVVNNGAAALVLVATALAAGREIVISRGEMVEIGDGFRLPDLLASTGARLREVGTTNRTSVDDYRSAVGPETGFILKVHPSNFTIRGFTKSVEISEMSGGGAAGPGAAGPGAAGPGAAGLRAAGPGAAGPGAVGLGVGAAGLGVPIVADIGSGLLRPDPLLPDEPDAESVLRDGADLVVASADKLLGGPQAGLLLGDAALIERLRRHPLARALRVDKLTLAALHATLAGPVTPTWQALRYDVDELRRRTEELHGRVGAGDVVASVAVVGGGGAPELELASWALALPAGFAQPLREGHPPIVGRVERGQLLLDLRCVPPDQDHAVAEAVRSVAGD